MSDVCFYMTLIGVCVFVFIFFLFFIFSLLPDLKDECRRAREEEMEIIEDDNDSYLEWEDVLAELGYGDEE